jgi:hypothetical protein
MLDVFDVKQSDNFFKLVTNQTALWVTDTKGNDYIFGTLNEDYDYFALPAVKEIYGNSSKSITSENDALETFSYIDNYKSDSSTRWTRSEYSDEDYNSHVILYNAGTLSTSLSHQNKYYIQPFGCL